MACSNRAAAWLTLILGAAPAAVVADAQARERPSFREQGWRVELAGAYATPLVRDANGTTVHAPWGFSIGGGSAWTVAPHTRVGLDVRGGVAPLAMADDGSEWDVGTSWTVEGVASVERAVSSRIKLRGGLGALLLKGPEDVLPFREASGVRAVQLSAEAGVAVRLVSPRPIAATVIAQGFRLGGYTVGGVVDEAGTVGRLLVGLRHGR